MTDLPPDDRVSLDRASVLLRFGITRPRRSVDALIERLERSDGPTWLDAALATGPLTGLGGPTAFARGTAPLESIHRAKDRGKELAAHAREPEERLAGLAGYFVAIAAALAHHGSAITTRPIDELAPMLLDLATVAPSPWTELFGRAALAARA